MPSLYGWQLDLHINSSSLVSMPSNTVHLQHEPLSLIPRITAFSVIDKLESTYPLRFTSFHQAVGVAHPGVAEADIFLPTQSITNIEGTNNQEAAAAA